MTKIEIENVLQPGKRYRVDGAKFDAMRRAMLDVLPTEAPGLTLSEVKAAILPVLPGDLFPGGAKAGWWIKATQLDLEAKRRIARAPGSPVRLYRMS